MQEHASMAMTLVIYAKDLKRLAKFYESVLMLAREDEEDDFVLLGSQSVELAIVQAPSTLSELINSQSPSWVRSETPIKPSFAVADVEAMRSAIAAAGGDLKAPGAAWTWRGALHLDGWDPEGNVFQLRQRVC